MQMQQKMAHKTISSNVSSGTPSSNLRQDRTGWWLSLSTLCILGYVAAPCYSGEQDNELKTLAAEVGRPIIRDLRPGTAVFQSPPFHTAKTAIDSGKPTNAKNGKKVNSMGPQGEDATLVSGVQEPGTVLSGETLRRYVVKVGPAQFLSDFPIFRDYFQSGHDGSNGAVESPISSSTDSLKFSVAPRELFILPHKIGDNVARLAGPGP